MDQFYYENNGEQVGPISFKDIKPLQIKPDTLVWYKGQSSWEKASQVEAFSAYLKDSPPPLPNRKNKTPIIFKGTDNTYRRETDITIFGVVILIVSVGYFLLKDTTLKFQDPIITLLFVLIVLIIKITAVVLASAVAKRQNRSRVPWGLFAFFFPSIALIIIGLLDRKLEVGELSMKELAKNEKELKHYVRVSERE